MQRLCRTATGILGSGLVLLASAAAQTTSTPGTTAKPRSTTSAAHAATAQKPLVLTTDKDKQSYSIGVNVGKSLRRDDLDIDPKILVRGIQDEMAGGKTLLTDDEVKAVLTQLGMAVRQKQEEKRAELAEENKKAGETFLAENGKKPGVVTLPSGLEYKVLT